MKDQLLKLVESWRKTADNESLGHTWGLALDACANDLEAILNTGNVAGEELPEAPKAPKWRPLKEGEIVHQGDEWQDLDDGKWKSCKATIGFMFLGEGPLRRKA